VGAQQHIMVFYDEEIVGKFIGDVWVEDIVVLELKSVR